MEERSEAGTTWLGGDGAGSEPGENGLWVGKHAADGDLLVFDPAESDGAGTVVAFYSLAKHRRRSFPRDLIGKTIKPLKDDKASARALEDYARRGSLRAEREDQREADRSAQAEQQRESVVDAHRRFVEGLGLSYEGVERTDGNRKSGRRTKCPSCGIALDDFAHAACTICGGVLCSCGACVCGTTGRKG